MKILTRPYFYSNRNEFSLERALSTIPEKNHFLLLRLNHEFHGKGNNEWERWKRLDNFIRSYPTFETLSRHFLSGSTPMKLEKYCPPLFALRGCCTEASVEEDTLPALSKTPAGFVGSLSSVNISLYLKHERTRTDIESFSLWKRDDSF